MYRLIDYGSMLRDRRRVDAYRRALAACISPTSVVLDLGAGLGTFGVMACQLGAARVYAADSADIVTVAEQIARANGVEERMHFLQMRASELALPEQVDVIVSDLAGALPLFEEHIPALAHAREHFLKPGGLLIPQRARLFCAPISSKELYARIVEPWSSVDGIDFSPAVTMALHTAYALPVEPQHLAAEPYCWAELDYATIVSPNVHGTAMWTMTVPQVIHGVALWFESILHDDIAYASGPWFPDSIHATMVLPMREPLEMRANETLRFTIDATLVSGRYVVTWQAGDRERQSTFLGEPRSGGSLSAREAEVAGARAEVSGDAAFCVSDRVLSRRVGDEVLLLHLSSGVYHVLNETGARIWALLENGSGATSIAAAVAAEYDIDSESAIADVQSLIASLLEGNLIRPALATHELSS
ncbi:MAG: PqqD family peptide modification chaperone [Acidobacteriota bacterium]|nr:PqqD family peptide modification chaperone [Acidobacteriota bacterium]